MGMGDWAPISMLNRPDPIPNPQSPTRILIKIFPLNIKLNLNIKYNYKMENYQDLNGNNSTDYPLHTNSTFLIEPSLESELKKLLENKNKSKDIKLDKISFLSKNIQSIGNGIPLIFCNITRLYLSNNNIVSLEGIEQFANLTHLSISYNLIEDIYELNHIINH